MMPAVYFIGLRKDIDIFIIISCSINVSFGDFPSLYL